MIDRHNMKKLFILLFWGFVHCLWAQSSADIQSYIAKYQQLALEQERKYGVPAPITLAQGIVESAAGKSQLTRKSNNHFGIKKWWGFNGPTVYAFDVVDSYFCVYNSAAESYEDHSLFLVKNQRYRSLFNLSVFDYRGWAYGLLEAHYAGAPSYAKALIGYIEMYKLYEINGGVKLRPGKTHTIVRTITREELVEHTDLIMDEEEESEEEQMVTNIIQKMVVEINDVRCTRLLPGETLASICMRYDLDIDKLLAYNETTDEGDFHEGDIVFLDKKKKKYLGPKDYYRVKAGESLYQISQMFGIRLSCLTKMNNISLFSNLPEGTKLRLK